MQDVVAESGSSAGLIYRYFTGEDDMIVDAFLGSVRALVQR